MGRLGKIEIMESLGFGKREDREARKDRPGKIGMPKREDRQAFSPGSQGTPSASSEHFCNFAGRAFSCKSVRRGKLQVHMGLSFVKGPFAYPPVFPFVRVGKDRGNTSLSLTLLGSRSKGVG